uniref:C2H2-type domain-containing protein n=1 Tax=Oryza meridionalis TaxID=40149 RepID=A0A0E0EK10_9ORYZ
MLPSSTPSSSGSEGTISDHGGSDAAPVLRLEASPCHLCSREFSSMKAVHRHMRVHQAENEKGARWRRFIPWLGYPEHHNHVDHTGYEGCGMEYKTHKGMGGHVASHIKRDKLGAAAGGGGVGVSKPEGKHPCNACGKEYLTGVALGGHKRKHYKKYLDLTLSLAPPEQLLAPPTLAPALAAIAATAALPPAETAAEVAKHGNGAEIVSAPPSIIMRIFGIDVEKPLDV